MVSTLVQAVRYCDCSSSCSTRMAVCSLLFLCLCIQHGSQS